MTALCRTAEVTVGVPLIVRLSPTSSVILLRLEDRLVAYRNFCPHMGIELDWEAGRLLTRGGRYLQCTGHGAWFDPKSGLCLGGPCAGEALTGLPVRVVGDTVMLDGEAAGSLFRHGPVAGADATEPRARDQRLGEQPAGEQPSGDQRLVERLAEERPSGEPR